MKVEQGHVPQLIRNSLSKGLRKINILATTAQNKEDGMNQVRTRFKTATSLFFSSWFSWQSKARE